MVVEGSVLAAEAAAVGAMTTVDIHGSHANRAGSFKYSMYVRSRL